jgi:hypothetical protein
MEYAAAIAAVAAVVGQLLAAGQEAEARAQVQAAMDRFGATALPDLQRAVAQELGPSAAGAVQADPQLKAAQMQALDALSNISDAGGLTLTDRANLNRIGSDLARRESAGRASISENMAARGIGGGGAEVAMQLANQQASADRASQRGMDVAGMAQQRALDAIMRQGQLAGNMSGQDWEQRYRAAQARDEIARYNAGARERASDANSRRAQQQYENLMAKNRAMAGQGDSMARMGYQDAQNTRNFWSGLGQAGASYTSDVYGDDDHKDRR